MAKVDFRTASVRAHGLPQACVTCGNDEDGHLVQVPVSRSGVGRYGCAMLLLLFGPVGWIGVAVLAYMMRNQSDKYSLPVCQLCKAGKSRLGWRLFAAFTLAGLALGVDCSGYLSYGMSGYLTLIGLMIVVYACLEYAFLARQFEIKVLEIDQHHLTVNVPNDDYPGLYQRHLDNALLYGDSIRLGTREQTR